MVVLNQILDFWYIEPFNSLPSYLTPTCTGWKLKKSERKKQMSKILKQMKKTKLAFPSTQNGSGPKKE